MRREQGLDLAPQLRIARAGFDEEDGPRPRRHVERRLK
jgi:hypothetical protein